MGITYKAFDANLHCAVAIKVIHAALLANKTVRERFVREARQAAQLRHPNVASIFHLGVSSESCFYAMEFIEGESVEQLVNRSGPLTPRFALRIAGQLANALMAAAKLRLVHRDLKPSNVMLVRSEDGEANAKLIDFGIGLLLEPQTAGESARLTQAGFVGTAHFASPAAPGSADKRAVRHLFPRRDSLVHANGANTVSRSVTRSDQGHLSTPPPLAELPPWPDCAGVLLRRMLEKEEDARPQTAAALYNEIVECRKQLGINAGTRRRLANCRCGFVHVEIFATLR